MAKTILFIEDEAAMQKTLGEFLTMEGYSVLSALDGELGLALAKSKLPNLILLDLILPKMSGFVVLKKLKEDVTTKQIPVIVLTNLSTMDDIGKVLEYGGTNYLVKSDHSLKEILDMVNKMMGGPA